MGFLLGEFQKEISQQLILITNIITHIGNLTYLLFHCFRNVINNDGILTNIAINISSIYYVAFSGIKRFECILELLTKRSPGGQGVTPPPPPPPPPSSVPLFKIVINPSAYPTFTPHPLLNKSCFAIIAI